jgi:hypothetical protein
LGYHAGIIVGEIACAQGHGVYIDKCGNRYEGGWVNDRVAGFGTRVFFSEKFKGDRYEGHFEDNKFNGWGKYVWANGDKYIGQWSKNMMDGRGTFSWAKVNKLSVSLLSFSCGVRSGITKRTILHLAVDGNISLDAFF